MHAAPPEGFQSVLEVLKTVRYLASTHASGGGSTSTSTTSSGEHNSGSGSSSGGHSHNRQRRGGEAHKPNPRARSSSSLWSWLPHAFLTLLLILAGGLLAWVAVPSLKSSRARARQRAASLAVASRRLKTPADAASQETGAGDASALGAGEAAPSRLRAIAKWWGEWSIDWRHTRREMAARLSHDLGRAHKSWRRLLSNGIRKLSLSGVYHRVFGSKADLDETLISSLTTPSTGDKAHAPATGNGADPIRRRRVNNGAVNAHPNKKNHARSNSTSSEGGESQPAKDNKDNKALASPGQGGAARENGHSNTTSSHPKPGGKKNGPKGRGSSTHAPSKKDASPPAGGKAQRPSPEPAPHTDISPQAQGGGSDAPCTPTVAVAVAEQEQPHLCESVPEPSVEGRTTPPPTSGEADPGVTVEAEAGEQTPPVVDEHEPMGEAGGEAGAEAAGEPIPPPAPLPEPIMAAAEQDQDQDQDQDLPPSAEGEAQALPTAQASESAEPGVVHEEPVAPAMLNKGKGKGKGRKEKEQERERGGRHEVVLGKQEVKADRDGIVGSESGSLTPPELGELSPIMAMPAPLPAFEDPYFVVGMSNPQVPNDLNPVVRIQVPTLGGPFPGPMPHPPMEDPTMESVRFMQMYGQYGHSTLSPFPSPTGTQSPPQNLLVGPGPLMPPPGGPHPYRAMSPPYVPVPTPPPPVHAPVSREQALVALQRQM
jgi:hypothetical protein